MTVLISFGNNRGQGGRCDAKCYNAKTTNCDCICGGENHGKGIDKAIENTRELAESWIKEAKKKDPTITAQISHLCNQLTLFDLSQFYKRVS